MDAVIEMKEVVRYSLHNSTQTMILFAGSVCFKLKIREGSRDLMGLT